MNTLLPLWQRIAIAFFVGMTAGLSIFGLRQAGVLQAWELFHYYLVTTQRAAREPVNDFVLLALTDADPSPVGSCRCLTVKSQI